MLPGVGLWPSFLVPPRGHLTDLFIPTTGNLPFQKKKKKRELVPGGWPGGMGTVGRD